MAVQVDQFAIRAGRSSDRVSALFERAYGISPDSVLNGTGRETFDAIRLLKIADPAQYEPEHGAAYPRSPFGQVPRQIAQLTKANVGLEVVFAEACVWARKCDW